MKKKEVSRKRKRLTKNEQVKVEKVPTKVKEEKKTEDGEKKDEKELKGIGNEKELKEVNEEEKEKKEKKGKAEAKMEEIVLIDLEEDWKKVPQHEDEVSLGPEEEDEERILFPTPKGAELQNLSFWESCHNKAKSRGEMEEKSREKEKRETNALRLARAEIRSAELSIIEKETKKFRRRGRESEMNWTLIAKRKKRKGTEKNTELTLRREQGQIREKLRKAREHFGNTMNARQHSTGGEDARIGEAEGTAAEDGTDRDSLQAREWELTQEENGEQRARNNGTSQEHHHKQKNSEAHFSE
ncbi:hypothetical protein niasHS_005075 [Heterodera schachtii]|uniref:Uncharacterized protein n=1 Tax=Heterodera schachtii TaxID=97005 RepID=A0ABD2JLJ9_HETSC